MKRIVILLILSLFLFKITAITVGQFNKTYVDPSRSNRQVPAIIYYPIDSANPGAIYPYIIFGHGWNSNYSASITLTNELVYLGWIVAYPRTEEGMFPSTSDFSKDIAFLQGQIYAENSLSPSVLFGKMKPLVISMGYSMGGACATVAATLNSSFVSLISYCAAPEIVSGAIDAAASVHVPSLTYSGSDDWVAPPSSNQVPLFNNLASAYKAFISITGVGHTSYYNNSLIPITIDPFLSYLKTGDASYLDAFASVLASHTSSLTYHIVNNLVIVPATPTNISMQRSGNTRVISWNKALNATNYKIYASSNPYTGYADVTSQGTLTIDSMVHWTSSADLGRSVFIQITGNR
ncbi:MAG TPA: hypothetical protein PLE74_12390 [Candidatus Cloacimonadota bacterium]|nr:hypothetical protein [Candidatus Cloacimonadota bacterium]